MSGPVETRADEGIFEIVLARPERGNALGPDLVEAALEALGRAAEGGAWLVVLRGAGKHFCTGFDLSDLDRLSDGDLLLRVARIEMLLQAVHHMPIPTLAIAHGATTGAGADLLAACQYRWALPGTRFAFPGAGFGLALGTRRLCHRVGSDAARDLVGSGRRIDVEEAARLGLVTRVVDAEAVDSGIRETGTALRIDRETTARINALTVPDTRESDMANLVASAARPGLKARITAYVAALQARKAEGGRG